MATFRFLDLATELQIMMLELIPQSNLLQLRLVSRNVEAVASSIAFKSVAFNEYDANNDFLYCFKRDGGLSKHVKQLRISFRHPGQTHSELYNLYYCVEKASFTQLLKLEIAHKRSEAKQALPFLAKLLEDNKKLTALAVAGNFSGPLSEPDQQEDLRLDKLENLRLDTTQHVGFHGTLDLWRKLLESAKNITNLCLDIEDPFRSAAMTGSPERRNRGIFSETHGIFRSIGQSSLQHSPLRLTSLTLWNVSLGYKPALRTAIDWTVLRRLLVRHCPGSASLLVVLAQKSPDLEDFSYFDNGSFDEEIPSDCTWQEVVGHIERILQSSLALRSLELVSTANIDPSDSFPDQDIIARHGKTLRQLRLEWKGSYTVHQVLTILTDCLALQALAIKLPEPVLSPGILWNWSSMSHAAEMADMVQCIRAISKMPALEHLRVLCVPQLERVFSVFSRQDFGTIMSYDVSDTMYARREAAGIGETAYFTLLEQFAHEFARRIYKNNPAFRTLHFGSLLGDAVGDLAVTGVGLGGRMRQQPQDFLYRIIPLANDAPGRVVLSLQDINVSVDHDMRARIDFEAGFIMTLEGHCGCVVVDFFDCIHAYP